MATGSLGWGSGVGMAEEASAVVLLSYETAAGFFSYKSIARMTLMKRADCAAGLAAGFRPWLQWVVVDSLVIGAMDRLQMSE